MMRNSPTASSFFRVLVSAAMMMTLAACASKPVVFQSDYDYTVDFSQYKSYGYFNPFDIEDPNYSTIYGAIFREAIDQEMKSRGYVKSENPDLLINVSGRLKEKTRVTNTSGAYMGGYYGYRSGFYGAWGGYGYGSSTHISQYTEGTINVDLVDRAEKRMVWEGIAIGRVNEKESNDETRASIFTAIQKMFAGYPFRAAQ